MPHTEFVPRFELQAVEYLAHQLGARVAGELRFVAAVDERPLETEGAVELFTFTLAAPRGAPCDAAAPDAASSNATLHYVVAGETNANYFPAYGLSPDDAYSLHIGTRFMLEADVQRMNPADEPPRFREAIRQFIRGCNPRAAVGAEELALLFGADDQRFAVYRVNIAGAPYYCMGGDLPNGFYAADQHPPQLYLRLHLGRVIREEARREQYEPRR